MRDHFLAQPIDVLQVCRRFAPDAVRVDHLFRDVARDPQVTRTPVAERSFAARSAPLVELGSLAARLSVRGRCPAAPTLRGPVQTVLTALYEAVTSALLARAGVTFRAEI
jgi:hypothetical protein